MNAFQLFQTAIEQANQAWMGCCWPTEHGPLKLNLDETRSRHAQLLAGATRGDESTSWKAAAQWLSQVETDAQTACAHSQRALEAVAEGRYAEAHALLSVAASLEAKYPIKRRYESCRRQGLVTFGIDPETKLVGTE